MAHKGQRSGNRNRESCFWGNTGVADLNALINYSDAPLARGGDGVSRFWWQEQFRSLRCRIVPVGGKNQLLQPMAVAQALEIPVFVVCDGDGGCKKSDQKHHAANNLAIQRLSGVDEPVDFPGEDLFSSRLVVWSTDIGKVAREDIGAERMGDARATVREELGMLGEDVSAKNPAMIGYALQVAWDAGHKSDRLQKLCTQILDFAAKFGPGVGAEGSTGGLELAVDHTLAANDAGDPVQPIVVTTSGHDVAANE